MQSSFTLLRVKGIPIGAHWSWLLVFGLLLWSLARVLFPATYPGLDDQTYLAMGIATAVLFFASILLHEIGHALQAMKEGMRIEGITLWLFGGVAAFRGMFPSPGAEFRIAVAGPVVSIALAGLFGVAALAGDAAAVPDPVQGTVDYLARINLILVLFNMIPALPLDGGRVLRSLLWKHQRSFALATGSAARAGKAFGGMLALVGILNFLAGGGAGGGLWLVFLGWFLTRAADGEAAMALVRQALSGRSAGDVMSRDPVVVPPHISLEHFLDLVMSERSHSSYPVVTDGAPVGLMPLRRAGQVPAGERAARRVSEVMLPLQDVPVISPRTDLRTAFEIVQDPPGRALVIDDGSLIGILSLSDVVRTIEFEQAVGVRQETGTRRVNPLIWLAVGVVMLVAAAALYHPPVVVLSPGPAFDVTEDISISGIETDEVSGEYVLVSVQLDRPSALGAIAAVFDADKELRRASEVVPPDIDPERFARQQRDLFNESQQLAAAAGAAAAGLEVTVDGDGARVETTVPGSPADRALRAGDVILAIDGRAVSTAQDVQRMIGSRPAGTDFRIDIERDGDERTVRVTSERLPEIAEGLAGIGVAVSTRDLVIDLPFEVQFRQRAIGGPSAGLAYALAIADLLDDTDYASGRTIAASGTVDFAGEVGPVGGLNGKTAGAERAGADILLVPSGQADEVGEGEDVGVHAVKDLREALEVLSS